MEAIRSSIKSSSAGPLYTLGLAIEYLSETKGWGHLVVDSDKISAKYLVIPWLIRYSKPPILSSVRWFGSAPDWWTVSLALFEFLRPWHFCFQKLSSNFFRWMKSLGIPPPKKKNDTTFEYRGSFTENIVAKNLVFCPILDFVVPVCHFGWFSSRLWKVISSVLAFFFTIWYFQTLVRDLDKGEN